MRVIIADDRKQWMIEEDNKAVCERCFLFKSCSSKFGSDCNRLGGARIPKINKGANRR